MIPTIIKIKMNNLEKQLEDSRNRLRRARKKVRKTILTYFIEGIKEKECVENSVVLPPYDKKIEEFIKKHG